MSRSFLGTPATAPGPAGPQMVRAMGAIRRDPLGYLEHTWRTYGDVVQYPIPRPPSYLVNEPAAVRRVLVDRARSYGKATIQYRALSLVTGEGLLTAETGPWRRQRRLVQPAFHHSTLEALAGHVDRAGERVVSAWSAQSAGDLVDADASMMAAALEVVGHALFGTDLSADADRLARATLEALEVVVARARVPITPPAWLPTPANRRLAHANRALDEAVASMVAERRARPAAEPADMLDLLLAVRDEEGDALSTLEVRDQMVTFIVAGHETVASALTWALAWLAREQAWQEGVAAEAAEALGDGPLTLEAADRMPVTRAVVDEVLRLLPPAWLITRRADEPDELGGCAIPAGSLIICSPALLHRHPSVWEDPERFDPSRFLDGRADRQAFLPFGAGPRLCIGRDFAYVEAVLMLGAIARRLRWCAPHGIPAAEPLVTIRPRTPLMLEVTRR